MNSSRPVVGALKKVLRQKGMTYQELGRELDMSEAGVKKMFQKGDLSVGRLVRICELLKIHPDALLKSARQKPVHPIRLTRDQCDFFLTNNSHFFYFLRLVYDQLTPHDIAKEYGLSEQENWAYLKKLDDLGLIQLGKASKVRVIKNVPLAIDTRAHPGFEALRRKMAQRFLTRVCQSEKERRPIKFSSFRLSPDRTEQLHRDVERLYARYKQISEVEKLSGSPHLRYVSSLIAIGEYAIVDSLEF
ncbi:MAG: helix-turn-helix domain-containing protein [Bdellovibrionales bacterium]